MNQGRDPWKLLGIWDLLGPRRRVGDRAASLDFQELRGIPCSHHGNGCLGSFNGGVLILVALLGTSEHASCWDALGDTWSRSAWRISGCDTEWNNPSLRSEATDKPIKSGTKMESKLCFQVAHVASSGGARCDQATPVGFKTCLTTSRRTTERQNLVSPGYIISNRTDYIPANSHMFGWFW